jgi:transcriptional regulator with XRE-family HTH domain
MFKDKLKELREKKGLSQQALSEQLFVSRSAVAKWENGNGIPSDVNLEAICQFFEVKEEWILDRKDIKVMYQDLEKKSNKVFEFVLGLVLPIFLFLLSVLPIYRWNACSNGEMCITLYVANKSIASILLGQSGFFCFVISFFINLWQFVFSFFYWKKNMKYGKIIQIVGCCLTILMFVVTFCVSYQIAINKQFVLFFQ